MNAFTKTRVYLFGFGLGAALLIAPAAFAQADANPDHFVGSGEEVAPAATSGHAAAHPVAVAHTQKSAKPVKTQAAAPASHSAATVNVAVAVADRKQQAAIDSPKR